MYLDIASSTETDIDIFLYDEMGKLISTNNISVLLNEKNQKKIAIDKLFKGIYWLKFVNNDTGIEIKKFF